MGLRSSVSTWEERRSWRAWSAGPPDPGSRQADHAGQGGGARDLAAVVGCVDEALAAAGLVTRSDRRRGNRVSRSARRRRGRHPLQCQFERQELPDRTGAGHGTGPARPGAKRCARRRLRRTPAGSGSRLSRRDRRVRRHRDRRLHDPGQARSSRARPATRARSAT